MPINCVCSFRFVISLQFRSLVPNGVLLYAADDVQNPTHFISLELINGQLVFKMNSGIGTVRVESKFRNYSDGGITYTVRYSLYISLVSKLYFYNLPLLIDRFSVVI